MNGSTFESLVHSIARELWSADGGAVIIDSREVDGVYETEDSIHIVEATIQRGQGKAQNDIGKLSRIVQKYRKKIDGEKLVKGWFVTKNELTAEQREISNKKEYKKKVTAISFHDFQKKLVDVRKYLLSRDNYAFGSVRNPGTGKHDNSIEYIPIFPIDKSTKLSHSIQDISRLLKEGSNILLTGDYGVGKSMTLREIYKHLKDTYLANKSGAFPVYFNMRDHYGQTNPSEAFFRHASNIGFDSPNHLIRSWRAGYTILLLDGFDEIATTGFSGFKTKLVEARFKAMELVRRFISETPIGSGIIISGRTHFFNTIVERNKALGLNDTYKELTLNDYDDDQLKQFLGAIEENSNIPEWIPRRPLLLGYLAAKGIISSLDQNQESETQDSAKGWDYLIDKIASREAEQEAGLDGKSVRKIMERIATLARKKSSGLGPISLKDLCNVYEDVCGIEPDEKGLNILQKLPGLGVDNEEDQSRSFIDEDLADACRSGDILLFAKNYSAFENGEEKIDISSGFEVSIGNICALIVAMKSETEGFPLSHALHIAAQKGLHQFSMDILKSCIVRGEKTEKEIYIHSSFGGDINFSSMETRNLSKVNFFSCYFNSINITGIDHSKLPNFRECYIAKLFTPDPPNQRPSVFCSDSVIERIENHTPSITNTALLNLDLPILTKVKLSILRKIYLQAGNGRVENALYAGLDHAAKQIVPDAIKDLESKGIIRHLRRPGKTVIWQPSPQHKSSVLAVIDNPESDTENILQ